MGAGTSGAGAAPAGAPSGAGAFAAGAALATVALWATNFPAIRYALAAYAPGEVAALRCAFGALAMGAYALVARMPLPAWRDWPALFLFGCSGVALSSLGLGYGLRTVSAGAGAFVIGMIPVFSALLARRFLGERLRAMGWLGIAVCVCGVVTIALGEGGALRLNGGVALLAGSAFAQAVFYVFQKPYLRRYTPAQITAGVVWCGALVLAFWLPGALARMAEAPWRHTAALAWQGVFPISFAFMLWSFALARARAALVTSAVYLMPLISLGLAWAWLGERPGLATLSGGALALGGVALLNTWGR